MQRMPKRPKRNQRLWSAVYLTIERFPAAFPVVVTVGFIPAEYRPAWAACDKDGDKFAIWLEEPQIDLPPLVEGRMTVREQFMWDSFQHEYAHILDWSHMHDQHEPPYAQWHGPTWGVWYAKIYQSLSDDP